MRTPREVSESYWAAECRRDIDAVMAHYHPDETYEDSAAAYPGLEVRILREFTGTDDSSGLEFYAVLIDPAGRRFKVRGVNVVAVRDGKFVSVRSYEDPPTRE